jgi:hypothetical protein
VVRIIVPRVITQNVRRSEMKSVFICLLMASIVMASLYNPPTPLLLRLMGR